MVNPNLIKLAKRQMNKEAPAERVKPITPTQQPNASFHGSPSESFIMSYDGGHEQFFQELITKTNEIFNGTHAEIPVGTSGEIQGHLIKRLGLITTIYNNPQLKNTNFYPITPMQSEALLKDGKLTAPGNNWEDLALLLYDRSQNGYNPKEAQAIYDSLKTYRQDLRLSENDLENKLIIVNAGIEVDSSMPHGIKPIVLPGLTQVYQHEALEKVGESSSFDGYGLSGGLPLLNQLGQEGIRSRILHLPNETEDIGLRTLFRNENLSLVTRHNDLANSGSDGRIIFAIYSGG